MKKEQFIKNLRYSLRKLKKDEREKYLAYYEEIISDMIENGVSEEEAVAHQGGTKEIAEEILRENAVKREFKIGLIGTVLIILTANYAQTECQFRYCGTAIPFLTVRSTAR